MSNFKQLTEYSFPKTFPKLTKEESFWKGYETKLVVKENGPINQIAICDTDRFDFAICSSYKIDTYCSKSFTLKKSFTNFKENPYCATFRSDGKVLAAGDAKGLVQVFDYESKSVLREMKRHSGIVRSICFGSEKSALFSVSDDKTLRLWDIATGDEKAAFFGHADYVRALSASKAAQHFVATGSYDHTVKLWDTRSNTNITFDHEHPVEDVVFLSGGSMLASAGGNTINIWDLVANKLIASIANHQKTVTCLDFDEDSNRLFAGSLDRQIKVMDASNYSVVFGIKFPSPLISMGICCKQNYIVAGSVNGSFMIKSNETVASSSTNELATPRHQEASKRVLLEMQKQFDAEKIVISAYERKQLASFDRMLKKFRHSEALDVAFETKNPQIIVVMLEELHRRGALKQALSSRDEDFICHVTEFSGIHIKNPNYSLILTEVINILFSIYSPLFGQLPSIDDAFLQLAKKVKEELNFQIELQKLNGIFNMVLANFDVN